MQRIRNQLAALLLRKRHLKGLTQEEAAALCGLHRSHYQKFEHGRLIPRERNAIRLARLCDTTPQKMLALAEKVRCGKRLMGSDKG